MARDNIPIVVCTENADNLEGAGVAINTTNGGNLAAGSFTDRLVLRVDQTFAGTLNLTVRAGVYPPAFRQGMGDLVLALTQAKHIIFLEAARFVQADGSINIDYQATMTGTVYCYQVPAEFVA